MSGSTVALQWLYNEQKTVRAARANEQKTNKRRTMSGLSVGLQWVYSGSTVGLQRTMNEQKTVRAARANEQRTNKERTMNEQ